MAEDARPRRANLFTTVGCYGLGAAIGAGIGALGFWGLTCLILRVLGRDWNRFGTVVLLTIVPPVLTLVASYVLVRLVPRVGAWRVSLGVGYLLGVWFPPPWVLESMFGWVGDQGAPAPTVQFHWLSTPAALLIVSVHVGSPLALIVATLVGIRLVFRGRTQPSNSSVEACRPAA